METQLHGKGAMKRTKLGHFIQRLKRPKVGKASRLFDWNVGYSSIAKIGNIPIKSQGASDSCAGQAGSYGMAIALALLSGKYEELSAKSIYSLIFYPNGGSTEGSIENVFKRDGATLESEVQSYPSTEQNLRDTTWKNPTLLKEALTRSGFVPLTVSINIESIAEAIRDYGFCILQINGQDGNSPDWLSQTPQPPQRNNPNPIWSHFICFVGAGLVNGVKTLTFVNSWGDNVGVGGYQNITQAYFDSKQIVDAFTFIVPPPIAPQSLSQDANNTTLTPQESSFFQQFINLIAQFIARLGK